MSIKNITLEDQYYIFNGASMVVYQRHCTICNALFIAWFTFYHEGFSMRFIYQFHINLRNPEHTLYQLYSRLLKYKPENIDENKPWWPIEDFEKRIEILDEIANNIEQELFQI